MLQVVLELQIRPTPRHGCVPAERVVREVEVVVRPLEDRQAGLEGVVEEGRRRLTDAAADRRQNERADDLGSLEEAPFGGAGADDAVEREDLARLDHGAVDEVGHQVDVVDPVRGRLPHLRRIRDELLADPEGLRLRGRQVGRAAGPATARRRSLPRRRSRRRSRPGTAQGRVPASTERRAPCFP